MKTAIEISFLSGAALLAWGLWMLAPWVSLSVTGVLIMAGASAAYAKEQSDTS